MRFIDEIEITVASGKGGDGAVSFRREKYVPKGGPNGGDGGRGGSVVFEATTRRNTLQDFRWNRAYRADDGGKGDIQQRTGAAGEDLVLLVPVGTVLYDAETDDLVADLDVEGKTWRLEGGHWGLGNVHFKSATRQTPDYATEGQPGTEMRLRLELKLIADVGLLGFPNAGKSTLLSRISAAKPEIGAYPFTTLTPNLGVVEVEPGVTYVVADIPGLIEGASEGKGLGLEFLRHVERCSVYLHLVSTEDWEQDPVERFLILEEELRAYDADLLERPRLTVLTKTDLVDAERKADLVARLEAAGAGPVLTVSSVSGDGIRRLVGTVLAAIVERKSAVVAR